MSHGYVAAICPLVYADTFLLMQHQLGGYFVPATCRAKGHVVGHVMGHVAGTKRFKDAMKLRVYGYATCPGTQSNVEPIRDNDQNSLCWCTGKNKMEALYNIVS